MASAPKAVMPPRHSGARFHPPVAFGFVSLVKVVAAPMVALVDLVGVWSTEMRKAQASARLYDELSRMPDERLARLGITRTEIATYVKRQLG